MLVGMSYVFAHMPKYLETTYTYFVTDDICIQPVNLPSGGGRWKVTLLKVQPKSLPCRKL